MTEELDNEIERLDEEEADWLADTGIPGEPETAPPAKAVPARKPGWLTRMGNGIAERISPIYLPQWDVRNFLYGLAGLIVLILIFRNWVDVRLDVVIWRFDIPKSVVIIASVLLGAALMRAWDVWRGRRAAAEQPPEEQ